MQTHSSVTLGKNVNTHKNNLQYSESSEKNEIPKGSRKHLEQTL